MQGVDEGKEGTKMKGRQERTRFDCPKSKTKVENKKFATRFSPNWCGFWRNGGQRRVQCNEADTAVRSKLRNKYFYRKQVRRHRTSN